jgi:hypothetical protein
MLKSLVFVGLSLLVVSPADLLALPIAAGQYYTDAAGISNNNTPFGYIGNDDNTFGPIALGFSFTLFGQTYTNMTISNNGNIQFGVANGSFSPIPLDQQTIGRMIAPYWSDEVSFDFPVGNVYLAKYTNEAIVTWQSMKEFGVTSPNTVSFQLVIRGDSYGAVPSDEGVIGFSYKAIQWGSGAPVANGHNATAGFGDGLATVNAGEVSYLVAASPRSISNTNVWFNIEGGIPAPPPGNVPEPGTWMMMGAGIAVIGLGRLRARR